MRLSRISHLCLSVTAGFLALAFTLFNVWLHQEFEKTTVEPSLMKNQTVSVATASGSDTVIRRYVNKALQERAKPYLAIVSWNRISGQLQTSELRKQCAFRDFTEDATWPFLLKNTTVQSSSFGTVALLLTSDAAIWYLNWTIESPVPLLAYTIPINALDKPWVHVIPTPYEVKGGARKAVDSIRRVSDSISFQDRFPIVMYRGDVRMNRNVRGSIFQMANDTKTQSWLNASKSYLSPRKMVRYRYLLDIGGLSGTTWTALRWKMCSGSLVFRVETSTMDWWHGTIRPEEHYIPVRRDLTDLKDRWQWAQDHPRESEAIARAGANACNDSLSLTSVTSALQRVVSKLPPATRAQHDEVISLLHHSAERLENRLPALLFSAKNVTRNSRGKRYSCASL